jgi:hypothetical protein
MIIMNNRERPELTYRSACSNKTSAGARAMHGFGAEVWYTIVS